MDFKHSTSFLESCELVPRAKKCKKCQKMLLSFNFSEGEKYFWCKFCSLETYWAYETILERAKISSTQLEILLQIFLNKQTAKDAYIHFSIGFSQEILSLNTIRRYFSIFSYIVLEFYCRQLKTKMLFGDIEIDETHLFREKPSFAPYRNYQLSDIWLFGLKERKTKEFIVVPVKSRDEATLIKILLRHARVKSTIYSDCYSVYVNNHTFPKKSKIMTYGCCHHFVNHRIEFINQIFDDIHTNGIESLWSELKNFIRQTNTKTLYFLTIARFYFHKTLSQEQ